jgi:hypothetical protein
VTALLGLIGSALGPAGIAALHVGAVVAARGSLGKAGAVAVGAGGLLLVAYLAGARQAAVSAETATLQAEAARAQASLTEERRQVLAAAGIASADARRAMAAEDEAAASASRLKDLEAYLAGNSAGTCTSDDDARRLRDL